MTRFPRLALIAAALAGVFIACSSDVPGPTAIVRALRTMPAGDACGGVGTSAVLRGAPGDPDVAWLESFPERDRQNVIWPTGFYAAFDPTITVFDASGRPQMRDGDYVDGGCVVGPAEKDRRLLLIPPFLAFALDCGPIRPIECPGRISEAMHGGARAWPQQPIATVRFLTLAGEYEILFEDGQRRTGVAAPL